MDEQVLEYIQKIRNHSDSSIPKNDDSIIVHPGLSTREWEYKVTLVSNRIHLVMMEDIRVCRTCGIVFDMKLRRDKDCPVCHGGESLSLEDNI